MGLAGLLKEEGQQDASAQPFVRGPQPSVENHKTGRGLEGLGAAFSLLRHVNLVTQRSSSTMSKQAVLVGGGEGFVLSAP